MSVTLGHQNIVMPQNLLHDRQAHPLHDEPGSTGMPEAMKSDAFGEFRQTHVVLEPLACIAGSQGPAIYRT